MLSVALVLAVFLQSIVPSTFVGVWYGGFPIIAGFAAIIAWKAWPQRAYALLPIFVTVLASGVLVGVLGLGFPTEGDLVFPTTEVSAISVHTTARMFCLQSLVAFLSMSALVAFTPRRNIMLMHTFLELAGLFTMFSIIFEKLVLHHPVHIQTWVGDNPSMTMCFVVLSVMSIVGHIPLRNRLQIATSVCLVATLALALYFVGASTPTLAAAAGLFYLAIYRLRKKPMLQAASLAALVAAAIYFHPTWERLNQDSSGRFDYWTVLFHYWTANPGRLVFGSGLGSIKILAPLLTGDGLFFAHSDFLQTGFELGAFGLVALVVAMVDIIMALWHRPSLCVIAVTFAACMGTNFPLHSPLHLLFLIVVVGGYLAI